MYGTLYFPRLTRPAPNVVSVECSTPEGVTGTSGYRFEYNLHFIKIPSHLDRESQWFCRKGVARITSTVSKTIYGTGSAWVLGFTPKMFRVLMLQVAIQCRSHEKKGSAYITATFTRNADVHHNLNVSNPVPKVYTLSVYYLDNQDPVCGKFK